MAGPFYKEIQKMKFRIREPFTIKLGKDVHRAGAIVDLTDAEAHDHLHKLEPVKAEPKPAAKTAAAKAE